jgi:hypothetical protein
LAQAQHSDRSVAPHATLAAASAAVARSALAAPFKLGPAELERVADGVLSRIEKRLRIERERRGM